MKESRKRHLNKYEKEVMFNTYLIKAAFVIGIVLNMILPVYSTTAGFKSILQYVVLFSYCYGLLHAMGIFRGQKIPVLQLGFTRLAQVVGRLFIKNNPIAWQYYGILLALDVLYLYLLFVDKSGYCYLYVGEDE